MTTKVESWRSLRDFIIEQKRRGMICEADAADAFRPFGAENFSELLEGEIVGVRNMLDKLIHKRIAARKALCNGMTMRYEAGAGKVKL